MRFCWLFAAALATAPSVLAQNRDAPVQAADQPRPVFEVASVRPNNTSLTRMTIEWMPNGRLRATNVPLQMLVSVAFGLRSTAHILNAPDWIAFERFDIEARPATDVPAAQHPLMLRALLEERFSLRVRLVPTEVPAYVLVRERDGAPLPRALRESTRPCTPPPAPDAAVPKQPAESRRECFIASNARAGSITGVGSPMASLALQLSAILGSKVVDQTGLMGRYDFEVTSAADVPSQDLQFTDPMARHASLIAALQDQLGLRIRRGTAPATAVHVEHVDRPTPN